MQRFTLQVAVTVDQGRESERDARPNQTPRHADEKTSGVVIRGLLTVVPGASDYVAEQPARPPYRLLITDDDRQFRESLRGIFETEGFQTYLAHSGEEALDIVQQQRIHLALLDQHLPRLTGIETLRLIRQVNSLLPVILLTGDNTQQLMRDALSAHAFCVMSKPVSRNVVVYTVQRALARSYAGEHGPAGDVAVQ
jgi:CheY-like chemotaxis protein